MYRYIAFAAVSIILAGCSAQSAPADEVNKAEVPQWQLAIHGGAGVILKENLSDEQEAAYTVALEASLEAGADVLRNGGSAIDAVEAAILPMEDNALFNAGVGAVYTAARDHELDASIMEGSSRNAGAVTGVKRVRNPILAARAVMEQSEHVMFGGQGADAFAENAGLVMVDNSHFDTERRLKSLDSVLERRARTSAEKAGTVGAVAIDQFGNMAAGTSTGGMTAKAAGRIGDAPMIGAATYAQNNVCAISATGHGEYFIRVAVAKTICARIEHAGDTIEAAAQSALDQVADLGGDGGVIVMGGDGEVAFVFNSPGMYRGRIGPDGMETGIYGPAN